MRKKAQRLQGKAQIAHKPFARVHRAVQHHDQRADVGQQYGDHHHRGGGKELAKHDGGQGNGAGQKQLVGLLAADRRTKAAWSAAETSSMTRSVSCDRKINSSPDSVAMLFR